jgi:hypothetical protein
LPQFIQLLLETFFEHLGRLNESRTPGSVSRSSGWIAEECFFAVGIFGQGREWGENCTMASIDQRACCSRLPIVGCSQCEKTISPVELAGNSFHSPVERVAFMAEHQNIVLVDQIEPLIFEIRGQKVMLDHDLAKLLVSLPSGSTNRCAVIGIAFLRISCFG